MAGSMLFWMVHGRWGYHHDWWAQMGRQSMYRSKDLQYLHWWKSTGWWFGMVWNHGIFDVSITVILGMSGEQLTFIFFKMVETTNQSQLILLKLLVREIYRYHRIRCRTRACVFSHMRSRTVKSSDLDLPKLFAGKLALVWEKWHLIKFKVQILEIVTLISGKHVELKECDYSHLIQHKNYYPLVI